MELTLILTDELIDIRAKARLDKDFRLSDDIRNELDKRGSFVIDSKDGQIIYHLGKKYTREFLIKNIKYLDIIFKNKK